MKRSHWFYYVFEIVIIIGGFFLIGSIKEVKTQLILLFLLLSTYMIMGMIHHKINHDLKVKIVIEYFVIGLLIFSAFIFLNAGRL